MEDLAYTPHVDQTGWGGLMYAYLSLSRLLRHLREEWEWSYSALPEPRGNAAVYALVLSIVGFYDTQKKRRGSTILTRHYMGFVVYYIVNNHNKNKRLIFFTPSYK